MLTWLKRKCKKHLVGESILLFVTLPLTPNRKTEASVAARTPCLLRIEAPMVSNVPQNRMSGPVAPDHTPLPHPHTHSPTKTLSTMPTLCPRPSVSLDGSHLLLGLLRPSPAHHAAGSQGDRSENINQVEPTSHLQSVNGFLLHRK